MAKEMKKVLLLLADGFEIYEASAFMDVIGWNKAYGSKDTELFTCGITKNLKSTFGQKVEVDYIVDEVDVSDFNALAIPGGFESYGFYNDAFSTEFQSLIRMFNSAGKTISSICVGALALGKSGILKEKKATTYNLINGERLKQLKEFGANVIDKPIVIDENIITSCSPETAIDVAFELLERLTNKENCRYIKEIMGFQNKIR